MSARRVPPDMPGHDDPDRIFLSAYIATHRKSMGGAFFLALLLGPLGVLYASLIGGVILIALSIMTLGWGLIVTWPVGILVAILSVGKHNERVLTEALHRRDMLRR